MPTSDQDSRIQNQKSICVFCSSRSKIDPGFTPVARELGSIIAERGHELVYGGTDIGLMGKLAESARQRGGRVIGVIPQSMVDHGIADMACDELIVTDDMRTRKTLMDERADAFVALPGGFGTLEELAEVLVLRQLDIIDKPIALINSGGFYDSLLKFFDELFESKFARQRHRETYFAAESPLAAIETIEREWGLGSRF